MTSGVEYVTDDSLTHLETCVGLMSDEQLERLAALGRQAQVRLGMKRWPLLPSPSE